MITTEQIERLKEMAISADKDGFGLDGEALRAAVETLEKLPLTADKCRITDDEHVFHQDYIERQKGEYSYLFHDGNGNAVSRYGDFSRGIVECYAHRANAEAAQQKG